jgi:hypothetical protein
MFSRRNFLTSSSLLCGSVGFSGPASIFAAASIRKRLALGASLYQILQILSVTLFEKTPILQALQASDSENDSPDADNQLILFDF